MSAYVKIPKHGLQNKFKIWNIDEKKYQNMEVNELLYFDVIYSMTLDFVAWSV